MIGEKGNQHPQSSSPSPAPRHRTLQRDPACLPSPPPSAWNAASVSTTSPNVPPACSPATIPPAAPITLPADGAQANTSPPITPALSERTSLKADHVPTPLLSVLGAQVTMTPVSPNAHHALPPLMFKWTFTNLPLSFT